MASARALMAALILTASGAAAAPSFTLVPPIPGSTQSFVSGVSDDGRIVGGYSSPRFGGDPYRSFLWDGAEHQILNTPMDFYPLGAMLRAVSGDGASAVGWGRNQRLESWRGVRWLHGGAGLGLAAPRGESTSLAALNYDASVAVGSIGGGGGQPSTNLVEWREGMPLQVLGHPQGATGYSAFYATTNAGDRHIGVSEIDGQRRPIIWDELGGFSVLRTTLKGSGLGMARGVAANGGTIVGRLEVDGRYHPAYWDESLTPHLIDLHPDYTHGEAIAVSDDGSTIVGVWADRFNHPSHGNSSLDLAFIWDEVNGARPLQDVLVHEYGLDLDGWRLHAAVDITPDGQTIVGMARIDFGPFMGFKVVIPAPGVLPVLLLGGLAACRRRR